MLCKAHARIPLLSAPARLKESDSGAGKVPVVTIKPGASGVRFALQQHARGCAGNKANKPARGTVVAARVGGGDNEETRRSAVQKHHLNELQRGRAQPNQPENMIGSYLRLSQEHVRMPSQTQASQGPF